jgi:hypothetical protein
VVTVTGGHNTRVSLAALIAVRPGHPVRMIYRARTRTGRRKDQRKGFTERRTTPGSWTPPTSSSAARSWWCGTA